MSILKILLASLAAAFSENIIFSKYLGLELFSEKMRDRRHALRVGLFITLSLAITCLLTSLVDVFLLKKFSIEYMRTPAFVLVMMVVFSALYPWRKRIQLPFSYVFSATAILGTVLIVSANGLNPFGAFVYGIFAGLGYTFSSFLFTEIRARLEYSSVPKIFEGLPILLVTAGLIALAFTGFYGMKFM